MARNRMISPDFFLDEELSELSPHARLLYIGLWQIADDINHTLPNREKWIKAQVFPYENVDVEVLLDELIEKEKLILFSFEDNLYFYVKNFKKHQRVDKPSKERKYPAYSESTRVTLQEYSTSPRDEVKISKVKRKENKISETSAIADDEVLAGEEVKTVSKQKFGNPDINTLIDYMKEKFELPILDETEQTNRNYCNLCIKKYGGVGQVKLLIDATAKHKFWCNKVTSFKKLYYKGVEIISSSRDNKFGVTKL